MGETVHENCSALHEGGSLERLCEEIRVVVVRTDVRYGQAVGFDERPDAEMYQGKMLGLVVVLRIVGNLEHLECDRTPTTRGAYLKRHG